MKSNSLRFYRQQTDFRFEKHWYWEDVFQNPKEYVGQDQLSISEICQDLGITSVWPFLQSLRAHVKDYRRGYYYAFTQSVSDEELELIVKATYKLVKEMVTTASPDVIVLPNAVGIQHILLIKWAEKNSVFVRYITDTRIIPNQWMLVADEKDSGGTVFSQYARYLAGEPIPDDVSPISEDTIEQRKQKLLSKATPTLNRTRNYSVLSLKIFKRFILKLVAQVKSKQSKVTTIDNIGAWYTLRDHFQHYRNTRALNKTKFEELPDGYFYFPLQFQPEQTIDVIAPYFNNQIESARLAAMSMPGDIKLVVKEHPEMVGRRKPSYYYKLRNQPNVYFVDYRHSGEFVIQNSLGVISFGGTTVAEAVLMGKPVIQLGNTGFGLALPMVKQCTDFTKMAQLIKDWALAFDPDDPLHQHALRSYVAATLQHGFMMEYIDIWEGRSDKPITPFSQRLFKEIDEYMAQRTGASDNS